MGIRTLVLTRYPVRSECMGIGYYTFTSIFFVETKDFQYTLLLLCLTLKGKTYIIEWGKCTITVKYVHLNSNDASTVVSSIEAKILVSYNCTLMNFHIKIVDKY